ncbi:MAG TPA: Gfo/Idh/MocA family oxidoreductase, partial [Candidatus Kryptonia bacterium]|nr:Gfo/Idh/MocA family oxidoreductase [Candidatus Kryptonia bacterium]
MISRDPRDGLGVVVVGTSFGCFTHVRALRNAGFIVRALVGQDPQRTAERARRFDIPCASTALAEALALAGVDAVTVATPPHTHAPIALAAIAAGKHVLCEKPFARDAGEARKVLAAAQAAGIVHLLGTEYRFDSAQALLARTVAQGAIGEPRLATWLLHVGVLADPTAAVPAWWADATQGGGWFGAHGSQVIDQIRATLGDFEGVSAALPHVAGRAMSADDGFSVQFRLRSGVAGVMQSTSSDWGPPLFVTRVTGSAGTLWLKGAPGSETVWLADRNGARAVPVPDELITAPPDPAPADLLHTAYDKMIGLGLDIG